MSGCLDLGRVMRMSVKEGSLWECVDGTQVNRWVVYQCVMIVKEYGHVARS